MASSPSSSGEDPYQACAFKGILKLHINHVDNDNLIKTFHDHQTNGFSKHGAARWERNSSNHFKALLQKGPNTKCHAVRNLS